MRKIPKTFRLAPDQIENAERYAQEKKINPSEVIRLALEDFFNRQPLGAQSEGGEERVSREGGTPLFGRHHI